MLLTVPYIAFDRDALPEAVGDARRRLGRFAADNGADRSRVAEIELAVSEALANVVLHAYPPGHVGSVRVAADIEENDLEIVITDDGVGLQPGPSPGLGVGLSIVAATADKFIVREREPHGIELWMRFQLRSDG